MENERPSGTIVSGFAVVLDEINYPAEVSLFHVNNEYDDNGNIAHPAGWKIPGGRYEKPRDESPRHTAQNETLLEIGINVELGKFFRDSEFGEAILEKRTFKGNGETFNLEIYTFFMKRVGNAIVKKVETNEGGASGSFSLKDVLLMPLARKTETGEFSPYGIHFSARRRIFLTLKRAGYDFLKLIPDLPELFDELGPDEVGAEVYWILREALDSPEPESAPEEVEPESNYQIEPAKAAPTSKHEKICPCDPCWQRWWAKGLINA